MSGVLYAYLVLLVHVGTVVAWSICPTGIAVLTVDNRVPVHSTLLTNGVSLSSKMMKTSFMTVFALVLIRSIETAPSSCIAKDKNRYVCTTDPTHKRR